MGSAIDSIAPESGRWTDIVPKAGRERELRALDVGAGHGHATRQLSALGYTVVALEPDSKFAGCLAETAFLYRVMVVPKLLEHFHDESKFDVILMNCVDHFYDEPQFIEQMQCLIRLCRHNAVVFFSMINPSQSRIRQVNCTFREWEQIHFSLDCALLRSGQTTPIVYIGKKDNKKMHPSREVGRFDNGESLVATG